MSKSGANVGQGKALSSPCGILLLVVSTSRARSESPPILAQTARSIAMAMIISETSCSLNDLLFSSFFSLGPRYYRFRVTFSIVFMFFS